MKYQVGTKVKYNSGDWLFYGTITAVIENSITPCYRLVVDRMVKKNCKFSITQFEFELEAVGEIDDFIAKDKWEVDENEYIKKISSIQEKDNISQLIPETPVKELVKEAVVKPAKKQKKQPKQPKQPIQETPILETIDETPSTEPPKPQKVDAWTRNLDLYVNDVKSNIVYNWVSLNRRLYNSGNLSDEKLEKLIEINFPFDKKKNPRRKRNGRKQNFKDGWERNLKLWIKGERNDLLNIWRQRSVKHYVDGKLSEDRITKLKEIGILK